MVRRLIGNVLDSTAQTLVNTVNCVGVMGKGIALEFKKRFPTMYEDYVVRCERGMVRLGEPYLYSHLFPPNVLNFPTKGHWRSVSRLSDIVRGLEYLEKHYDEWGITSLAVPPLGCGQGQLEWRVVGPTLYRHLKRFNIPVELYAPFDTPRFELEESFLADPTAVENAEEYARQAPKVDPAWVALIQILAQIYDEPYHWPVGRTMFQKITYFATESGLPTGLHFDRGSYGPFAPGLKPLEAKLVNNGLVEENECGSMLQITPGPTFKDALEAFGAEISQWQPIIERVADLFLRMQTRQAEIAASVHFAAHSLEGRAMEKPSEADVLEEVKRWKERRRPLLDEEEIAQTIRNLNMLHWLDLRVSDFMPQADDMPPYI